MSGAGAGAGAVNGAGAGEVGELLQTLIRNRCVNDGTESSGHESRNAATISGYLSGAGFDVERFEPVAGRASLVARIEGTDRSAPSMLYMGHTDVVPANPENWTRDPFGGEIVEGEIWGRGAVDMLNITSAMAVALKRLAGSGFRPRGSLTYLAVADEEAAGRHGASWLVENAPEAVAADYVITESGGIPIPTPAGMRLPVVVGEKGCFWCVLRVHGTAGHASAPLRADNALVTAAEVVRRIAAYAGEAVVSETWRRFVEGMAMPPDVTAMLLDPDQVGPLVESLPQLGLARQAHACTHTTFAPTILHAGSKTNVIPDTADLQIDIRTLPAHGRADVEAMLDEILGDLASRVEVLEVMHDPASESPIDTPLWEALSRVSSAFHPGAETIPFLTPGATDARFFRRIGATAYGYGLFSERMDFERFVTMFHGADERVDVDSLEMSAAMFEALARDFLG